MSWGRARALLVAVLVSACGGLEEPAGGPPVDPLHSLEPAAVSARDLLVEAAGSLHEASEAPAGAPLIRSLLGSEVDLDLRGPALDLADAIERLFESAELATTDGERAIFDVPARAVCDGDPGCEERLAASPIRLSVTSPAEGQADVEILAGGALAGRLALHGASISAFVDLSASPDLPFVLLGERIDRASGAVLLELARTRNGHRLSLSIASRVEIAGGELVLRIAAAAPALQVEVDHGRLRITASAGPVEIGTLAERLVACGEDGCAPGRGERLVVSLPAVTGSIEIDGDVLRARGLGVGNGPGQLRLDAMPVLSLDLNASHGRTFDATVTALGSEALVEVAPALDARLQLRMSPLASIGAAYPAWCADEELSLEIRGAQSPQVRIALDAAIDRIARVEQGELRLGSRAAEIVVGEGECLVHAAEEVDAPWGGAIPGSCE